MNEVFNQYQTMSITSFGPSTLEKDTAKVFAVKTTNNVDDIDGARSTSKYTRFLQKAPFLQSDVPGSTPKVLIHGRNVRDNSLYIDDIDGTRHTIKDRMMRTSRHVDPLSPAYPLPSFAQDAPMVPRFIKDPLAHDDVEGSHVKPKKIFSVRDTLSVKDIDGAQADWRPTHAAARLKSEPHDLMASNIDERTHFSKRTQRRTDPCNPVYYINGMEYADDRYSRPKALKAYIADNHILRTDDITGAVPTSANNDRFLRTEFRNTNFIGDIEGAQADSTKHSIVTTRQTNPLAPVYRGLDPGEVLAPLIPSLIPPALVTLPTIPTKPPKKPTDSSTAPRLSLSKGPADSTGAWMGSGNNSARLPTGGSATMTFSGPQGNRDIATLNLAALSTLKPSPSQSARSPGGVLTPGQRRVAEQRQQEIDLVRQLQL